MFEASQEPPEDGSPDSGGGVRFSNAKLEKRGVEQR